MKTINIGEAKAEFSSLVGRAEAGEEIVIARGGKPVGRMVAYQRAIPPKRVPGAWKGKVKLSQDFDALPKSTSAAFRGERP